MALSRSCWRAGSGTFCRSQRPRRSIRTGRRAHGASGQRIVKRPQVRCRSGDKTVVARACGPVVATIAREGRYGVVRPGSAGCTPPRMTERG